MAKPKKIKNIKSSNNTKIKAVSQFGSDWYLSDDRHFSFSFTKMPDNTKYSIEKLDRLHLVHLIKKLRTLSKMTWADIKRSGRHQLGSEIIDKNSLNVKLPAELSEDIKILAFRYYDKRAFVGYRTGKIFHILYIDYDYTLYKHI